MPVTVADLLTVAGLAGLVWVLFEVVVKRAMGVTPEWVDRFGPVVAICMGIGLALAAGVYLQFAQAQAIDYGQQVLNGLLAGFSAMGISDSVGSILPAKT